MKPICVPCQRFFRPSKSGIRFTEGMPINGHAEPGKREPEKWKPYKLWMGDEWTCPDCSARIIVGVGLSPVREHYQSDFAEWHRDGFDQLQINDC